MPATLPFEVLAEELGAVAGRIEREATLRITAALSDIQRRDAERELRLDRLEREWSQMVAEKVASMRDGRDGEPGTPGERGLPGERGERGEPGERGLPGERGEPGEMGERGLPGERGEAGLPGERGEHGERGLPGEKGGPGERGLPGERGERGEQGERGLDGAPGERGEPGERGLPGERGPEGAPGKLPVCRSWEDRVHYEGDVVTLAGATFQALRDTAKQPPHEDWICLAERGADGTSFRIAGTYEPGKPYRRFDIAALNGGSFVALRDDPGPCPGADWQLIASPGRRGEKGLPGDRGDKGDKGERGELGPAVIAGQIDPKDLKLSLVRDDGEIVVIDCYPLAEAVRAALS